MRSQIPNPHQRSNRIMSPWPMWNSTESLPSHRKRCMPKEGRCSVSVAGRSSWSGQVRTIWTELARKISCPPGAAPGPPPGSRRKDHTRCSHRIRKSPGRKRHRPAVSAPHWHGSAGSAARSDLARRQRWPAARRRCPGRLAGRCGGPATLRYTRCRSPAPSCRPGQARRQDPQLCLRDLPHSPPRFRGRPVAQARTGVVSGQPVPGHPVAQHMLRRASHTPSVFAAGQPVNHLTAASDNPDCGM